MTKENLIKTCKEISKENNIKFNYYDDEFIGIISLKFRKEFKTESQDIFRGLLIEMDYIEIEEIKSNNDLKQYLKSTLQKHNIIE